MFAANLRTFFQADPAAVANPGLHARIYSQVGLFQSCCSHNVTKGKDGSQKEGIFSTGVSTYFSTACSTKKSVVAQTP
jgi:hypothetical protein